MSKISKLVNIIVYRFYLMDDRPIKGNPSGKYNMNFIDPDNDIPAYYSGMTELADIVVDYFL